MDDGGLRPRYDDVQVPASWPLLPPRMLRDPDDAPTGSVPDKLPPCLSRHHSKTLPCMSYKPHALAVFWPTRWVVELELDEYHPAAANADSLSPVLYVVVVPARQAYSHCASVGKSSSVIPVRLLSRPMKLSVSTEDEAGHCEPDDAPRIML